MTWQNSRDISPTGDFVSMSTAKQYKTIYNRDQLWSIELFWSWENQQVNWKTIRGWCYLGKCAMFTIFTLCWTILGPDGTGIQLNRATLWEPGALPSESSVRIHSKTPPTWRSVADAIDRLERAMAALLWHCNTLRPRTLVERWRSGAVSAIVAVRAFGELPWAMTSHDKPWQAMTSHDHYITVTNINWIKSTQHM